jgi:membrane-associated phospholipid phosphatase
LIVASTVLVKQHYLADVAGGLVLATVTSLLVIRATRAV